MCYGNQLPPPQVPLEASRVISTKKYIIGLILDRLLESPFFLGGGEGYFPGGITSWENKRSFNVMENKFSPSITEISSYRLTQT